MSNSHSPFGQNEWLVEEMYRKFREDPSSVDPSWHEFLVDYSPEPADRHQCVDGRRRRRTRPAPVRRKAAPKDQKAPATPAKPKAAAPVPSADGERPRCCAVPPRRS